ncbi:TetR/AcrR family transcriptional regulator [Caminibacter pacificus]
MKEKILKTALKHFAKSGYENTSMKEIAEDLGITKPALYYHYKSKNDLYNEIFKHHFQILKFQKQPTNEENIIHYIKTMSEFFHKNPDIAKLFAKELSCEGEHLQEETLKIMSRTIKFLQESLPNDINPFFIQTLIISAFTTFQNTLNLRKKVSKLIQKSPDFNIDDEITMTILSYIKAKS